MWRNLSKFMNNYAESWLFELTQVEDPESNNTNNFGVTFLVGTFLKDSSRTVVATELMHPLYNKESLVMTRDFRDTDVAALLVS